MLIECMTSEGATDNAREPILSAHDTLPDKQQQEQQAAEHRPKLLTSRKSQVELKSVWFGRQTESRVECCSESSQRWQHPSKLVCEWRSFALVSQHGHDGCGSQTQATPFANLRTPCSGEATIGVVRLSLRLQLQQSERRVGRSTCTSLRRGFVISDSVRSPSL